MISEVVTNYDAVSLFDFYRSITIILFIPQLMAEWKIFRDYYDLVAWKSLVPFYNIYLVSEKTFASGVYCYLFIVPFMVILVMATMFKRYISLVQLVVIGILLVFELIYSIYFNYNRLRTLNADWKKIVLLFIMPSIAIIWLAMSDKTEYLGTRRHIFIN